MNDLWTVLSEVTDISAKLSSKDTLGLEEVDEVRLLPAAQNRFANHTVSDRTVLWSSVY